MTITIIKAGMNSGEDKFMTWMSSLNASVLSKFPSLSCESQSKLRDLYSLNLQADSSLEEVTRSLNRCCSEYEALSQKVDNCFQVLGVDDKEDFSNDTLKALQDIGTLLSTGNIGDGTDVGAVSCLATDALAKATLARQKITLVKDLKKIQRKNSTLKETLHFFERETKMAGDEAFSLQSVLDTNSKDTKLSEMEVPKLAESISALRTELKGRGVSSTISSQVILDTYQLFVDLQNDMRVLQNKLKKYGELPPSIAEASKIVAVTKEHLATVVADFKHRLTSVYVRGGR